MGHRFLQLWLAAALGGGCLAQAPDPDFKARAFEHVKYLAGLGSRVAGSEGNEKAMRYVAGEMKKAGLAVTEEPFEFDSFTLEKATLGTVPVERVVFDAYSGAREFTGTPVFVGRDDLKNTGSFRESVKGRILVTPAPANAFLMMFPGPKAAVAIAQADFEALRAAAPDQVTVRVAGKAGKVRTANVAGALGPAEGRFVMITAHLDSVASPGASDNASGVAVMLELARRFGKSPPNYGIRFVALGAEEVGMLGAQAYIARHKAELERCALVFNVDTLGGAAVYLEARGGVQGVEKEYVPVMRAQGGPGGSWLLPEEFHLASNVPDALKAVLAEIASDPAYNARLGMFSGSDHLAFARAGVVATNIAGGNGRTHTPEDTAEKVDPASLERAGKLVTAVIERYMKGTP